MDLLAACGQNENVYSHVGKILSPKFDIAAKRRKNHKNKILQLIISIGYDAEFR
jgi:hypothetical protein